MAQDIVINFDATGRVEGMHRDEFSLDFLGHQRITRASEIKFNEATQLWDIYFPFANGWHTIAPACGFSGYNVARDFEVALLNACRLEGIDPLSYAGEALATQLRGL